jgi:hypothetical protein
MLRKLILLVIWVGFATYTVWLAPIDQPYTWFVGQKLLTLQWQELNAFIPALFWLMGIWSMIYGCLMFADGRMQNFRAWTYFIGSMFTGVISLLPYLILRQSNQEFCGNKDEWLKFFDKRSTGVILLACTITLLAYAFIAGDWNDYVQQFQTKQFVHLISLDFCLMALIFPLSSLFEDDMARRGLKDSRIFWAVALLPLFGPLIYVCLRPRLLESLPKKVEMRSAFFSR